MRNWKLTGSVFAGAACGLLAAAVLTTVVVSATQANESDDRSSQRETPRCLDGDNVGRTHVIDQKTLLVYDSWGNPYKLDVGGPCRTMNDMTIFGFEFNGSTQICRAHDAVLLRQDVNGTMPPARCLINGVKPLTRAEAAELDKE